MNPALERPHNLHLTSPDNRALKLTVKMKFDHKRASTAQEADSEEDRQANNNRPCTFRSFDQESIPMLQFRFRRSQEQSHAYKN